MWPISFYEQTIININNQIKGFGEQTKRLAVQVDAQEAGATIRNKEADTFDKSVETQLKIQQANIEDMSNDDLFKELASWI